MMWRTPGMSSVRETISGAWAWWCESPFTFPPDAPESPRLSPVSLSQRRAPGESFRPRVALWR
jgi:hypothetical protein